MARSLQDQNNGQYRSLICWKTRASVGSVVRFIFNDEARKVTAGQLGLVVWNAGPGYAGRDVLLADGRTVNVPNYELRAAGSHADCFTLPTS